ncbi:MAG TPA: host attachment protein [Rhizobiaceae bacterium]
MILPNGTTVLVSNGHTIRLFRNKGVEPAIRLVELPDPEISAHNQGSGGRHRTSSANPDDRRLAEDDFAAAVAEYVNGKVLGGEITTLFIVADPRTLGEIRRHLHPSVPPVVIGELDKDLTHHPVADLQAALAGASL